MQLSEQKQEELFSNIINPNTGKKIQLGKSMSFNTDVFDSKTPYQQKIDEQKSFINRNEPIRMNLQALEDIQTVPSDMQVDYQEANNPQKNWYDTLNVASPEEIAEWRKKGKMGFGETAQKIFQLRSLAEKIPFLGTTATVGISADLMWSIDRLKKGKEISDAEKDLLVDYLRNLKEVQVRGTTLSSNVLNSIAESVPFAIEFAVGLGAIPVTGGGSSTLSMQALSKIASKKAAQKAIQNEIKRLSVESTMTGVKKNISGATTKQLLNQAMKDYALGGASQTAKIMSEAGAKTTLSTILKNAPKDAMRATVGSNPLKYMSATRFANNFADRQLAGSMYVTDAGEGVFTNPENWALSFMKAIGTTVFDNYSETVGFMFAPITNLSKWFAKPIRKVLPKKFYENLDNLVNSKFGMKASDAFRKYGYDGVLEEMGEELVNRFLCQTFGINGLDEYNIDGFLNNVLYANNPIQWATEALSFSAMSGAGHTIYGASSAIKEWNKKITQSKSANALAEQMNNSDNAEYRSKQITKIQNQFEKYLKSNPINLSKNATPEEFQQKYDEAKFDFLENLSKKNMSAEEFYLEQGLVKIKGSQSAAERLLRKKLAQKGVDENTINDFIQSASENQIRDELKNHIIQDNEEKQKQQSEIERKKNEVVDKSYKLLLKGGVEKNVAWANAKLFGQFYEKYGAKNNQVFDKWFDKWEVEYNIPANERNARFQSANTAGAETSAEISDAQKEWREKGTDSKYFKKWFGDSKVVDENGQPELLTDDKDIYITDGYSNNGISRYSYKGSHRSPSYSDGDVQERLENSEDVNLLEVAQGYHNQPDDYFSPIGARYYMYDDKEGLESARAVRDVIAKIKNGKENITVKIYRAVPADVVSDKLKNGDWVTLSKSYAIEHGEQNLDGEYKIIEKEVPINEVWWDGNDLREWGYDNGKEQEADLYLKIEKPKYQDALPTNWHEARELRNQGYDGVITSKGEYLVFEKEQIKSVDNLGTFDESNPNIYYQTEVNQKDDNAASRYSNYEDLVSDYSSTIEDVPNDYNINVLDDALKDLGIDKDHPQKIETPNGNVLVTDKTIEHIIDRKDDKTRYKSINKMFATLKNPTFVNVSENGGMYYFKIFKTNDGTKNQTVVVRTNELGEVVETTYPTKRDNNYFKKLKIGKTVYDIKNQRRKGDYNTAPVNNSITNNSQNINPAQITIRDMLTNVEDADGNVYYQSAYHGTPHKFDEFSTENIGSGEGHQAHGWGLYFASDKKVSEAYRKKLALSPANIHRLYKQLYINGGKSNVIKYIQDNVNTLKQAFNNAKNNKEKNEYAENIKNLEKQISIIKDFEYDNLGQLYEVEIPENDEMLDEDLPFSEQPKKVQDAIKQICEDYVDSKKLVDLNVIAYTNNTPKKYKNNLAYKEGRNIYGIISEAFGGDKQASLLLNEYGIKGIKYNGQTDGQCYVIFNPENIDITRTFYQEGVNQKDSIEQRTDKSKYLTDNEVEQLKKDKENFVVYVQKMIDDKLSPLTQIRVLEKLPSAYNKISQLKGKKVVITQNVYKKIIDLPNKFNKNHNIDKKRALKLPEYLSDPLYILQSTSEGNEHRFVVVTASKGNKPKEKLSIILQPNNNVAVVSAYDEAINISEEKKNNRVLYDKKKELSKTLSASKAVTIDNSDTIITNSTGNFNSEQKTFLQNENEKFIAGYSYQEVMDKLSGLYDKLDANENSEEQNQDIMAQIHVLEDAYEVSENPDNYSSTQVSDAMLNAYYVMNNQKLPQDFLETDKKSERTYSDLLNAHNEKKEKQINEYHGYFTEGQNKNIITIMQSSNKSTALHELGHLFLNGLNELAKVSEDAKIQLDEVNKWLGYSGEYTVQQHEKFARSFEAYLYKGKAPNNKLRQVFENFKEWLKSVYKDISELVNQGADISDEVQQMFDRMFGNDEQYQEQKQVNELVNKIKKLGKRAKKPKETNIEENDETAKRHKEVCYEILSLGTGKSIKYLKSIFESNSTSDALVKKRDNIEKLLDKVDDKISASGGMQPEWLEFFSNTGVSYNNDEVNASAELVRQAYDKIVNRAFGVKNYDNYLSEKAEYFEQAIEAANLQFDALVKAFKNENRDVALSAIYEWLEQLDEEIKPDFENKIIYEMGAIERNENADKFDIAKRKILQKTMDLEQQQNLKANEKYKQTVMEIIKNLDFLQPADKAKLTANILDVPSVNFLMHKIDNIMDIAKTMEDVHLRRMLEIEIHKELQSTKNIKKNGRTVGKYDYKTNKLFEELRELDRLSTEQANDIRLNAAKFSQAEDTGLSFKDKLINKFLSYKAGGRTYSDTELMKSIYDDILKVKLAGKCAKSEIDLNEKLDATKDIDELIEIVENKKDANFVLKGYINIFGNVESTLNALFNKEIKERYGSELLYAETNAQAWQHQQKQKFEKEVAKIYGLPKWCWDKKILEYLAEKHTYPEIRRKYAPNSDEIIKTRIINRTLTKMDIIQAYIWSKNDILEKRLINQFGEETLSSMFDEMSSEDVKLAELLMSTAQSFYPLVNKAFINKYGLDLPKVSCYFPSTPERGSEVDLFNEYSSKSLGNGFTKSRAESEILPMDFHNPVATLYSHIDGVSKFVFMSDILDKMNLRFKDLDLKRVIINKFGDDVHKTLIQELANVTYKKEAPVFNGMNKILDNAISNWITGNIAVKPIVGLKQLLSANNYAVDMPYLTWQKGFLKSIADYKNTIDYMMKIPYLKARYEGNFSNEFLKQTIENSAFATSKKLKDLCTIFVKIGDIGAIIFGGKPYIDYLINEKGMSEDEAIKQFVLSTNRSQQSSAISSLSNFQVNMTRNPIGKLFIAFKNSPQQYVRMCADALISATNGDMSAKQCARVIFQYAYVQPLLYTIATSGALFRFMFTGDDDDIKEDAISSIFNLNADALPIVGDIYKFAIQKLLNQKALPQSTPLLGDIQTEINRLAKDGATAEDYLQAIGYLCLHVGLGYNSRAMFTMGSGVGDIFTGNPAKGSMKVFGYTDKRAKRITEK